MGTFFVCDARCPHGGLKEGSHRDHTARWASTLSADRMRPVRWFGFYTPSGLGVKAAGRDAAVKQNSQKSGAMVWRTVAGTDWSTEMHF